MGAVAVAQHLHATVPLFNYNNVTVGIERDARGALELAPLQLLLLVKALHGGRAAGLRLLLHTVNPFAI